LAVIAWPPKEGLGHEGAWEYACLNWCYHFHQGLVEGGDNSLDILFRGCLMKHLDAFASCSVSAWVNTLIYHQDWEKTFNDLSSILSMLKVCMIFYLVLLSNDLTGFFPAIITLPTRYSSNFGKC
jgi:hypothetical protein